MEDQLGISCSGLWKEAFCSRSRCVSLYPVFHSLYTLVICAGCYYVNGIAATNALTLTFAFVFPLFIGVILFIYHAVSQESIPHKGFCLLISCLAVTLLIAGIPLGYGMNYLGLYGSDAVVLENVGLAAVSERPDAIGFRITDTRYGLEWAGSTAVVNFQCECSKHTACSKCWAKVYMVPLVPLSLPFNDSTPLYASTWVGSYKVIISIDEPTFPTAAQQFDGGKFPGTVSRYRPKKDIVYSPYGGDLPQVNLDSSFSDVLFQAAGDKRIILPATRNILVVGDVTAQIDKAMRYIKGGASVHGIFFLAWVILAVSSCGANRCCFDRDADRLDCCGTKRRQRRVHDTAEKPPIDKQPNKVTIHVANPNAHLADGTAVAPPSGSSAAASGRRKSSSAALPSYEEALVHEDQPRPTTASPGVVYHPAV